MTRVAFIVNGDERSAMAIRARSFAAHLSGTFRIEIAYREGNKIHAAQKFFGFLRRVKPALSYVFDMGYSGVIAASLYKKLASNKIIVDTGDAIYELARTASGRGRVGVEMTRRLEDFSCRIADGIVVRGTMHKTWLAGKGIYSEVVNDGVDTKQFAPQDVSKLRTELGLDGVLTIGLVGSSIWSEKLGMCYGWELVELLRLLKDKPVKGVFIGGGSGIDHLKSLCRQYGIEDKIDFLGHVLYEELPAYLNTIDVCLSTQTNNLVGQVRTTGKLPLYLSTGRYVLASDVGEASLVLDDEMRVPYFGLKDDDYPARLCERAQAILDDPRRLAKGQANVGIARHRFEYEVLARRLADYIESVVEQSKPVNVKSTRETSSC